MQETPAIACTLTDLELRDRRTAWMKVGRYATDVAPIPGGLQFRFTSVAGVDESLATLIQLEAECCAWMTLGLQRQNDSLVMSVTALGADGELAVRETFAPLSGLVQHQQGGHEAFDARGLNA